MSDKNFSYRYRAPTAEERREVEGIKNFYEEEKTSDALTNLRKLDARVKNAAKIPSVAAGVAGTLLFGLGLSMVLEWKIYFFGVFVALAGAITALFAVPLYSDAGEGKISQRNFASQRRNFAKKRRLTKF